MTEAAISLRGPQAAINPWLIAAAVVVPDRGAPNEGIAGILFTLVLGVTAYWKSQLTAIFASMPRVRLFRFLINLGLAAAR
jgi:hypothetical protein